VRGHGQGSLYLAAPKSHQQGVGREAWQGHAAELSWYNLPAIIPTLCPLPYSVSLTTLFILGFHMPCSILTRLHAYHSIYFRFPHAMLNTYKVTRIIYYVAYDAYFCVFECGKGGKQGQESRTVAFVVRLIDI
jgi:hypothetical protein